MHWGHRPSRVVVDRFLWKNAPNAPFRCFLRNLHHDGRQRLSNFWMPTSATLKKAAPVLGVQELTEHDAKDATSEDSNDLLVRGGFVRQAYSGIFHFLPLGLRVQEKLERLVDKHMRSIGASKVSLSSISSQGLWEQSGRLKAGSEFFKFHDRKDSEFLLSPTHEEEITQVVAAELKSYRDLPIRLYQISRKYRDEMRPRQGLLRGREFVMKDLYTFDADEKHARATYEEVRLAYNNLFDEVKVPYIVASADSGAMGGDMSHEYHYPNEKGEDDIISCDSCYYICNEEIYSEMPKTRASKLVRNDSEEPESLPSPLAGSPCPNCSNGKITIRKAIEVGHTFHLGTRYSEPLNATIAADPTIISPTGKETDEQQIIPVSMGCHGIGISRLISAVASVLVDSKGLNWPRVMAPFDVILVPGKGTELEEQAVKIYDLLSPSNHTATSTGIEAIDTILDDRPRKDMGWKLKDADLIGVPVIVIVGRSFSKEGKVEVQCRRLEIKELVEPKELRGRVEEILREL